MKPGDVLVIQRSVPSEQGTKETDKERHDLGQQQQLEADIVQLTSDLELDLRLLGEEEKKALGNRNPSTVVGNALCSDWVRSDLDAEQWKSLSAQLATKKCMSLTFMFFFLCFFL